MLKTGILIYVALTSKIPMAALIIKPAIKQSSFTLQTTVSKVLL